MNPLIRPFTRDDYPALIHVRNAALPEYPGTVEEMRYHDQHRDPKCEFRRWVAEQDGRIVAAGMYSQSPWMYHPRKFEVYVTVHPDFQCRGIGSALYDQVMGALAPLDPLSVRSHAREDMARSVRFLQKRGFVEDMREWESRLDVPAFDPAPFAGAEDRVRGEGIAIKTFKELEADPERDRKLYELETELSKDVPHPDEQTPVSYEHYVESVLRSPNLLPEGIFVAVGGGEYVGMSALWRRQADNDLDTGLTGVRRPYRRRGIALAMKLRAIAYARAHGHPVIRTENETGNRGMLSINERLGFVKQPAWVSFVKVIKEGTA
jgi:GNAT superfamily N-acetyltransferase